MKRLILISLFLSSIIWVKGFDSLDSLDRLPPNLKYYYLSKENKSELLNFSFPDSQNVRMVGKWGRGPSSRVTGRDNLVFLSLGSEVAIVDFSDSNPQIVYEVQARGLVAKSVLKDSFLFIGGPGIEIWNIANPSSPVFRNRIITNVSDLCIKDTFLYAIAGDSFRIFNIADIDNPYRVGASNDVGYYLSVSGNYAYVSDRWGLYILNIQNPSNPQRINAWGENILSAQVRDSFCYVSVATTGTPDLIKFFILNVSNPNSIREESYINYAGGYDVYLLNYFAYVSGYYLPVGEFQIIDISNPSFPAVVSRCTTAGWNNGVWVNNPFSKAFVADDWEGLQLINISNPTSPYIDTTILGAEYSLDVWVDRNYAYIANRRSGLKIIDISNPAIPFQVGEYDTIGDKFDIYSAVARDSFAYVGAPIPFFKFGSIDVSNPSRPVLAGTDSLLGEAKDMIVRDSFVYVAGNYKFQIYNVSNPRQPRLVGSCISTSNVWGFDLKDTFGYVAGSSIKIINVANPSNPRVITTLSIPTPKVAVTDTFAYILTGYDSLSIWNIANPYNPYQISSICLRRGMTYDVIVESNLAYVGSKFGITIIDVSNPLSIRVIGSYNTPDYVRRVFYSSPLIYCALFAGGMCILEKTPVGINEEENRLVKNYLLLSPNPTNEKVKIKSVGDGVIYIYNILGKEVKRIIKAGSPLYQELDISNLPEGCYIIYIKESGSSRVGKVVINKIRR